MQEQGSVMAQVSESRGEIFALHKTKQASQVK